MASRTQELQELSVLVRHVPRIVISSLMRKSAQSNGLEEVAAPFTAALAMFEVSGFSTLGSNLSDLEKDQIKNLSLTTMKFDELEEHKLQVDATRPADPTDSSSLHGSTDTGDATTQSPTIPSKTIAKPIVTQMLAVDTLTTTLNKTLQPIIDIILRHNGDIIKFAGDAMIVLWETEITQQTRTPAGILTYRAARCAVEALRILKKASTPGSPESKLSMRVGVGASQVTPHHVGGMLDRWEFYVSGDANRQMSLALQHAPKARVALSLEAYGTLTFSMATKELPSVYMKAKQVEDGIHVISRLSHSLNTQGQRLALKPSLALVPALRGYVPGTIVSCLQKGLVQTSCAREVTAIFIKLSGIVEMIDTLQQAEEINRVLRIIQSATYKLQGALKHFIIDGQTAVVAVIMGLPPFYHENNAVHGVKLACSLLSQGIQASIGITTGTAFCGSVGSKARAKYTIAGASVNLAGCLMSAANIGEAFCDARTYEDAKDSVHFTPAHKVSVKSRTEPVTVYCVLEEKGITITEHSDFPLPLPFDCDHVLAMVPVIGDSHAVPEDDASDGSSHHEGATKRVLIVSGETGTGKTMLLQYLWNKHSCCFLDSGDPDESVLRFQAWAGIVRDMISQDVKLTPLNRSKSVKSTINDESGAFPAVVNSQRALLKSISFSQGMKAESEMSEFDEPWVQASAGPRESVPLLEFLVLKGHSTNTMLPILNDLLPHDQLFEADTSGLEQGQERATALEGIIFAMLQVLTKHKRMLLLFDNAHLMDPESWRMLQRVLEQLPNVSVLLAVRTKRRVECPAMLESIGSMEYSSQVELHRFSYAATSQFLGRDYHILTMEPTFLDFVHGRTDGNPAEIVKLVDFMLEEKFIRIDRKRGVVKILRDLVDLDMGIPQHTRTHVMACVDTLDSLAQIAVKVVSVHPEPVEETLLVSLLRLFLNSQRDDISNDMTDIKINDASFLGQLRAGLAVCSREEILSLVLTDSSEKLYAFRTEEMRLVVCDMMIPSQRQLIHMLYAQWFTELTERHAGSMKGGTLTLEPDGSLANTMSHHRCLAQIAYHQLGARSVRLSLDTYRHAAEYAIKVGDLDFASEYMACSQKILDQQLAHANAFSELDLIAMRSRIEFVHGAIAVERRDYDRALTHMALIMAMCESKGASMRRNSARVYVESVVSGVVSKLKASNSTVSPTGVLDIASGEQDQTQAAAMDPGCMPRLFRFGSPKKQQLSARRSSLISSFVALTGSAMDPESLRTLQQVNFFRRKAAMTIKYIHECRQKQEAMALELQRFMQHSLQAPQA